MTQSNIQSNDNEEKIVTDINHYRECLKKNLCLIVCSIQNFDRIED